MDEYEPLLQFLNLMLGDYGWIPVASAVLCGVLLGEFFLLINRLLRG